jgi:hypothetical protein
MPDTEAVKIQRYAIDKRYGEAVVRTSTQGMAL